MASFHKDESRAGLTLFFIDSDQMQIIKDV